MKVGVGGAGRGGGSDTANIGHDARDDGGKNAKKGGASRSRSACVRTCERGDLLACVQPAQEDDQKKKSARECGRRKGDGVLTRTQR